ncbi:hypothetical protein [Terriglobus aquaticus]|nr:hypothetical protein [Terriglobus aquaticus]
MGGPRACAIRRIETGKVCCKCRNMLPPRTDGGTGARLCLRCMEEQLRVVIMTFAFDLATDTDHVGLLERDGMTPLPWTSRYKTQEPLYKIINASRQPMHGMVRLRLSARSSRIATGGCLPNRCLSFASASLRERHTVPIREQVRDQGEFVCGRSGKRQLEAYNVLRRTSFTNSLPERGVNLYIFYL